MTVRHLATWLVLAVAVAAPAPSHAQAAAPAPVAVAVAGDAPPFGVRAGDVVHLWVWREPDLTGEFPVDARGRVVLPLLGELDVAGRSAEALSDDVRSGLQRYLTNPSIRVTVLRRIAVQGQVARPGLYPVDATVTVGDLIALAGGIGPGGDAKKVRLVRGGRVIVAALGPETVLEQSAVQSGDQVYVPQKPWLARNGSTFLWAALTVVTAVVTFSLTR